MIGLGLTLGLNPQNHKYSLTGKEALGRIISSTICDLDATIKQSYSAGQVWANIETSPADGSAQSDNDFHLGTSANPSSDDPTFTGTAGSSDAYFLLDGDNYFRIASGINTPFLRDMHKTPEGSDFWIMAVAQIPDDAFNKVLFSNAKWLNPGITTFKFGGNVGGLHQYSAGAWIGVKGPVIPETPSLIIFSHSHFTNKTRIWVNSTVATNLPQTFKASTEDAAHPARIASYGNGNRRLPNLTRIYSCAYGNEYLDDTKAALIFAHINKRHNRIYA